MGARNAVCISGFSQPPSLTHSIPMRSRLLLLACLLLIGATLAMGGVAWWLLGREANRIEALASNTLANRTATVAENVDLLMEEIRTGVSDGLLSVREAPDTNSALQTFVSGNPYVRAGLFFRGTDKVTLWFGRKGDLPSMLDIACRTGDVEYGYPWSVQPMIEEKSVEETAAAMPVQNDLAAPSDAIELVANPQRSEVQADGHSSSFQGNLAVQSNVALKQQRAAVRKVNTQNQLAVAEQQAELDTAMEESDAGVPEFSAPLPSLGLAPAEPTTSVAQEGEAAAQAEPELLGFSDFEPLVVNAPEIAKGLFDQNEEKSKSERRSAADRLDFSEIYEARSGPYLSEMEPLLAVDEAMSQSAQRGRIEPSLARTPLRQGWTMVEEAGVPQWLAWVNLPGSGDDHIGAFLSREAVLSELAKTLSFNQSKELRFVLIDGEGKGVIGERPMNSHRSYASSPELSLEVGTSLPGWRIEAWSLSGSNPFGRSFVLFGGVVVAGLCLAMLLGGSLLLWQAHKDATEAQRKTTFVANVSHELKTPLTSIRLFAEMLHDGRAKDPAKQQRYLRTMLNETQRLTRLVNNVLDFSRLERGKRDYQHERIELVDTVQELVTAQQERLAGEGLTVELELPTEPLHAEVDRDALEQILLNLLDNAAKYASEGERAIVALTGSSERWALSVRDFGPGIAAAERKRVFEAFHRVDDRLTAERPGSGLGLSIATRLARGMGGELTLSPVSPSGCCFTLNVSSQDSHG